MSETTRDAATSESQVDMQLGDGQVVLTPQSDGGVLLYVHDLNPEHETYAEVKLSPNARRRLSAELRDNDEPGTSVLPLVYAQRVVDAGLAEFTAGHPVTNYQRVRWVEGER